MNNNNSSIVDKILYGVYEKIQVTLTLKKNIAFLGSYFIQKFKPLKSFYEEIRQAIMDLR